MCTSTAISDLASAIPPTSYLFHYFVLLFDFASLPFFSPVVVYPVATSEHDHTHKPTQQTLYL